MNYLVKNVGIILLSTMLLPLYGMDDKLNDNPPSIMVGGAAIPNPHYKAPINQSNNDSSETKAKKEKTETAKGDNSDSIKFVHAKDKYAARKPSYLLRGLGWGAVGLSTAVGTIFAADKRGAYNGMSQPSFNMTVSITAGLGTLAGTIYGLWTNKRYKKVYELATGRTIHGAAEDDNVDGVQAWEGFSWPFWSNLNKQSADGTPLIISAKNRQPNRGKVYNYLVHHQKVNVDAQDGDGNTAAIILGQAILNAPQPIDINGHTIDQKVPLTAKLDLLLQRNPNLALTNKAKQNFTSLANGNPILSNIVQKRIQERNKSEA